MGDQIFSRTLSSSSQSGTGSCTPSVEALKIMGGLEEEESKRVKSDSSKAWLQGPHSISRQSCRFELPMDMLVLEQLSPLQYVSQFCRVNSRPRLFIDIISLKLTEIGTALLTRENSKAPSEIFMPSPSTSHK